MVTKKQKAPPTVSARATATARGNQGKGALPRAMHREFFKPSDFEKALQEGQPVVLQIAEVHDSPYQEWSLRKKHLVELTANMKANNQITPILVRKRKGGGHEIIAGHHRKQAKINLGETTILAVIVEMSDEMARRAVVYDNLLGPNLNDYEKFQGLHKRLQHMKFHQKDLAEEAGISKTQVSRLLSYLALPEPCHVLLREHPDKIGANTAEDLRELVADHEALVIQAIEKIIAMELKQKDAAEWIKLQALPAKQSKPAAAKFEPKKVLGARNKVLCEVRRRDKSVIVSCRVPEAVEELDLLIEKTVREYFEKRNRP